MLSNGRVDAMARLGFRFAEYRPETGEYRLSPSYRTLQNFDRGTLTFQQSAVESRKVPAAKPTADAALFEPAPAASVGQGR